MTMRSFEKLEEIALSFISTKKYKGDFKKMIDNNFELKELEVLGEGSFGKVIKCFDKKSWRFYAMKI